MNGADRGIYRGQKSLSPDRGAEFDITESAGIDAVEEVGVVKMGVKLSVHGGGKLGDCKCSFCRNGLDEQLLRVVDKCFLELLRLGQQRDRS